MKKKYYGVRQADNNRSNLPQEVSITDVSSIPCGGNNGYDDTMMGIDEQLHGDIKGNNRKDKAGKW